MLKKTVALTAVALGLFMAAPAQADFTTDSALTRENFYMGLNYSSLNLDLNSSEATLSVVSLSLGFQLSPYVSIEGRYGFGAGSDTSRDLDPASLNYHDDKYDLTDLVGGYAKFSYPFSEYVSAYGLLGATRLNFKVSDRTALPAVKDEFEQSGFSWGFGFNLTNHKNVYLSVEYLRLQKVENLTSSKNLLFIPEYTAEAYTVGLHYKF